MDARLVYWTAALLNMILLCVIALRGVRQARMGEVARHRRSMLTASALVIAFVVSYVPKVIFLGKEQLELWSPATVYTLYFHELCVAAMLLGGGVAVHRGIALSRTRLATHSSEDPAPEPRTLHVHRIGGRIAVTAALLGALAAGVVLLGMYDRSP